MCFKTYDGILIQFLLEGKERYKGKKLSNFKNSLLADSKKFRGNLISRTMDFEKFRENLVSWIWAKTAKSAKFSSRENFFL